jgi:GH15 family glucan-1,4-alpha-glucosidase
VSALSVPLEDYALLGDLHTAALVSTSGSVDWMCVPRFDSGACFAALLDEPEAGHWRIAPADGQPCRTRRYRPDTLILETDFETAQGAVRLVDFMPIRSGGGAELVRIVVGLSGRVAMQMSLQLRFDYGSIVPWVHRRGDALVATAGPDSTWLRTPVRTQGRGMSTHAEFEVAAGDRVPFVLMHRQSHDSMPSPRDAEAALTRTEHFWRGWMTHCHQPGAYSEAVRRSLITLKALTYDPTGAIVAAPTSSLPEEIGGERNWDYRYCWLRDASLTLSALIGAGFHAEARAWREWLLRAVAGDPADLQILYGVDGTRRIPETTLDWLPGYEKSAPVRIGNAAHDQFQLDVWGEVLDGLHLAREAGLSTGSDAWALQLKLLDFLEGNWQRDDSGLWEVRGATRPFVHSKVMAWAGVDRAVRAVENFHLPGPVDRWRALAYTIHAEVCARGYDPMRNTFTQFYGSSGLDAALLMLPRVGFLPWDDPRVIGTVEAVQRELDHDGFLLRYDPAADGGVDGLAGSEGAFLVCTFWLVEALARIGRRAAARELFDRLLALRNDVGLLAEEYDARSGRLIGNYPQAFSHLGLVSAAMRLAEAENRSIDV